MTTEPINPRNLNMLASGWQPAPPAVPVPATATVFQRDHYQWTDGEPWVDLSNRDSIIRWLAWNDHNGCYTDADCDAENLSRLTLDTARWHLASVFESPGSEVLVPQ